MPTAHIHIRVSVLDRGSPNHIEYTIHSHVDLWSDTTPLDQCKQAMADHLSTAGWLNGKAVLSAFVLEAHYRDHNDIYRGIV